VRLPERLLIPVPCIAFLKLLPHRIRKTDELKVEVADINCPCHPEIDFTSKKIRIIHNSFEDIEYLDNLIK
jgi:hypothetical protein